MIRYAPLIVALLVAPPAAAQDQGQAATEQTGAAAAPADPLAAQPETSDFDLAREREKVRECEGEKFVFAWGAGARPTRVTLCSNKGASSEEVVGMLEEAAAKIEVSSIPEDRRNALVQQIRAKIAELEKKTPSAEAGTPASALTTQPDARPLSGQLPFIPPPGPPPVTAPAVPVAKAPIPAPRPPAAALPKPNLKFECMSAEFRSGGPCITLSRDTILIVKAADALQGGARLQFVRNGDIRSEQPLGQLRKGQSVRLAIPSEVCSGVSETEVELRVIRGSQGAVRQGQYLLRC